MFSAWIPSDVEKIFGVVFYFDIGKVYVWHGYHLVAI